MPRTNEGKFGRGTKRSLPQKEPPTQRRSGSETHRTSSFYIFSRATTPHTHAHTHSHTRVMTGVKKMSQCPRVRESITLSAEETREQHLRRAETQTGKDLCIVRDGLRPGAVITRKETRDLRQTMLIAWQLAPPFASSAEV